MQTSNQSLLTRRQAAEYLGLKENTLAVWATNKRYNLKFYKVGRLIKYKLEDLEIFLSQNSNKNGGENA
jgi:excisionase family DNA binding protein